MTKIAPQPTTDQVLSQEISNLFADAADLTQRLCQKLQQAKQQLKPKQFTQLLESSKLDRKTVQPYLKVAQAFAGFTPEQIKKLGVRNLFTYAADRYKVLRSQFTHLVEEEEIAIASFQEQVKEARRKAIATWVNQLLVVMLKSGSLPQPKPPSIWKRDSSHKRYWQLGKCHDNDAGVALNALVQHTGKMPTTIACAAILEYHDKLLLLKPQAPLEDEWSKVQRELHQHIDAQSEETDEINQLLKELEHNCNFVAKHQSDPDCLLVVNEAKRDMEKFIKRLEQLGIKMRGVAA